VISNYILLIGHTKLRML